MKTSKLLSLAVLSLSTALIASAESVKLTRAQASELYVALATAEAGFSPTNTVAAADNLNALRPSVEALDKGRAAYQKAVRALVRDKVSDAEVRAEKLTEDFERKGEDEITVPLAMLALSDEEITAAKVKPGVLSVIRRWLVPSKK